MTSILTEFAGHVEAFCRNKRGTTAYTYQRVLTRLELFLKARALGIEELDTDTLEDWVASYDHASANTRRYYWTVASTFARFLVKKRVLDVDPTAGGAPDAAVAVADRFLEKDAVAEIIAAARRQGPRPYTALMLLYNSGFRRDEACKIGLADIKTVGGATGSKVRITVTGKGGKKRAVTVNAATSAVVKAFARQQARRGSPWLFSGQKKTTALSGSAFYRIVKKITVAAGHPDASCHHLRHAFASHSLSGGATVQDVRSACGHASLSTTSKYLHSSSSSCASDFL